MTRTLVETAVITNALELACHAPSLHNTQPWRWVVQGAGVDLFVDRERIVTSTDGSGREAVLSCGAALDHLRVAMAAVGWETHVDAFPNPNNLDHLVSADFTPMAYVGRARRDRADAITVRRTDRRPFRAPNDWPSLQPLLRNCVNQDLVGLEVLGDDARPRLAEATRLSEALRRYDDSYHHELSWWTAPSRENEGIPQAALVSGAEARGVGVNREFPTEGDTEHAVRHDQAKIVLLWTPANTRADALSCGEALSAVLLECTMAGLATCPITHATELEPGRAILRELTGGRASVPQVLIRVGIAPSGPIPAATPRRPLGEVLEVVG
ncbi:NAD(P)H nitroreductase [Mycobacterium sp. TY814]|uniref:Acg family FMN-binding oxidoreductase n=1 Tax=unclassified Mycobacterium TaxID=2642494 RepID=UPI002741F6F4|nr:NAD(P)H nitroreductase [Mycobacterium sp. TY814]MDP7724107.1 NAD(P)H nitroreductase [Mycobacterium sp. TY814]